MTLELLCGASEDDLIAARSRYRGTSAEYARFSKAMDLPQQRERVTVDGLGNIGQGKYKADTPPQAKQETPQQPQDTQKGNSPVEQNNAVQSSTEAVTTPDNVNNKSVDKSEESGIIKETEETREFEPLPREKVVPVMRDEFDKWIPSVTGEEYASLIKYTKNEENIETKPFFERLNTALREKAPLSDRMKYHSDNISSAINKFDLSHDIICYRATKKNFFDEYAVGESFYADYFFSSSVSRKGAIKEKFLTIIRAPKGSKCAYIEKLSLFPLQREVLFDKSCKYRVIEKNDKYMVIEVIGND